MNSAEQKFLRSSTCEQSFCGTIFCLLLTPECQVHKNKLGRLINTESLTFLDYVDEIFSTTKAAIEQDSLAPVIEELKLMTPAPMNTMLEKQDRQEAIKKREQRKSMVAKDVPPTTSGN